MQLSSKPGHHFSGTIPFHKGSHSSARIYFVYGDIKCITVKSLVHNEEALFHGPQLLITHPRTHAHAHTYTYVRCETKTYSKPNLPPFTTRTTDHRKKIMSSCSQSRN